MKRFALLLTVLVFAGCSSVAPKAELSWKREDVAGHTLVLQSTDYIMRFRFSPEGHVSATFGDRKDGWTMMPALRWQISEGNLKIFDDRSFSYSFTLIHKRHGEVTVRTSAGEAWIFCDTTEEPNQSLEPTTMLGTSAAEQPLVPSMVVAHL